MPLMIELPPLETQHALNLARWAEVLADHSYDKIPGRAETDRYGHITMSPPAPPQHGRKQTRIAALLSELLPDGITITECPISTSDGVKGIDDAWFSPDRFAQVEGQVCVTIAPEICVEVVSPSNSRRELRETQALYFEAGAREVWFCEEDGAMRFIGTAEVLERSRICPEFPTEIRFPTGA